MQSNVQLIAAVVVSWPLDRKPLSHWMIVQRIRDSHYFEHERVNLLANVGVTEHCPILRGLDKQIKKSKPRFTCKN